MRWSIADLLMFPVTIFVYAIRRQDIHMPTAVFVTLSGLYIETPLHLTRRGGSTIA